jgi:hypothetical protein
MAISETDQKPTDCDIEAGEKAVRVGNISDLQGIKTELGALYKQARRAAGRHPTPSEALALSRILSAVREAIETDEILTRVNRGLADIAELRAGKLRVVK